MSYLFDRIVNRWDHGSAKWEIMKRAMGDDASGTLAVSVADMDFVTAPEITAALHEELDRLVLGYAEPTPDYYEAVIDWMKRRHHWPIEKESIVTAPGIVSAIHYLIYALTQPGDGVIIQPPVYPPFARTVNGTGRKLITNPLINEQGRYRIDFDDLERKAALSEAKLLIFCSPHNPVGRVWEPEELGRIAHICEKHDVLIISDEIHFDIVFPPHKHHVFATISEKWRERCITCTSPSKTFNLAGLQVSNIVIPDKAMRQKYLQSAGTCGFHTLNCLAYCACIAAYNRAEAWLEAMLDYVQENDRYVREQLNRFLPQVVVSPLEGTYLKWLDFQAFGMEPMALQQMMRYRAKLFFDDGFLFGEEGKQFLRFNIAYPKPIIEEVVRRLANLKITQK